MYHDEFPDGFWEDSKWVCWEDTRTHSELGQDDAGQDKPMSRRELEASLRYLCPEADLSLVPYFYQLLYLARDYHLDTGRHLNVYAQIGELHGAITYGISLAKLGDDQCDCDDGCLNGESVKICTITPFSKADEISVALDGTFQKLLVVRIDRNFRVSSRLVSRRCLVRQEETRESTSIVRARWDDTANMCLH